MVAPVQVAPPVAPVKVVAAKPILTTDYKKFLTGHEAACYWMNYPKTANWYIRSKNELTIDDANRSYYLVTTFDKENPNLNCSIPGYDHPMVSLATPGSKKILTPHEAQCYWQNYPDTT